MASVIYCMPSLNFKIWFFYQRFININGNYKLII